MIIKVFLLLLIFYFLFLISAVQAQQPAIDVASMYEISDKDAVDGDILMYSPEGKLVRATVAYSPKMFGVLQDKPLAVYRSEGPENNKPVVRAGIAQVNVTNTGGAIKAGDYITTSSDAGKGQKSTISGYALGIATKDINEASGKIPIAIRIEYVELTNTRSVLNLLNAFNIAAFQGASDPEKGSQLLKYTIAGLIVLISLIVSLVIFGKSILKSIDALGRNPLAKTTIQFSIFITAVVIFIIMAISIGVAFVILRL